MKNAVRRCLSKMFYTPDVRRVLREPSNPRDGKGHVLLHMRNIARIIAIPKQYARSTTDSATNDNTQN